MGISNHSGAKTEPRHDTSLYVLHLHQQVELVSVVLQVHEDNLVQDTLTDLNIRKVLREVHDNSELLTQVGKALLTGVKVICLEAAEHQLHTVSQERVLQVAQHDTIENFLV